MQVLEMKYAEGVVRAATEVFETMIFMSPSEVTEFGDYPSTVQDEVIGILGFTGTYSGLFAFTGSMQLARAICASMLGMEETEIEGVQDVADSFGELVNMVAGNFKNLWVADGNTMDLTIPSVVFGEGVSLTTGKSHTSYACRMKFDAGCLDINIRFNE